METFTDFSVWGIFIRAGIVIKLTMLVLLIASGWSVAIMIEKWLRLKRLAASAAEFEDSFWAGGSLDELHNRVGDNPSDPLAAVFSAAMNEWQRSTGRGLVATDQMRANLQERIERVMEVTLGREMERLEKHMVFLATAGATAPFIGLFGTVWGIMNSFQAIAVSDNTNITVIAPGLSEALFTTAMGLVVAIPAIAAFNRFQRDIQQYALRVESFASEFTGILSRQLDEGP
ncbi:MAG: protein TolQ [Alphaproteobacteria bacterium]|nr:protein TolQ [Alphaproteobacteria bacterium]